MKNKDKNIIKKNIKKRADLISIIIVNYNGRKFLPRLIKSLKNQIYKNIEILLIDNTSKDSSVLYIKEKHPNINTVIIKNNGYGSACNIGAKHAKGKYLMFFNEDMYIPKDFVEKMIKCRKTLKNGGKKMGAIGCKIVPFDTNPKKTEPYYGGKLDFLGFPNDNYNPNKNAFIINGCPFFIEKKLFLSIKGFNKNIFLYGEDADFSWRLKIFGYDNYINNKTCLYHYGGGVIGKMSPKKLAYIIYGSFIPVISNFNTFILILILPIYFIHLFFLNFAILIYAKFNVKYNLALIQTYMGFFKKYKAIIKHRKFVQKKRKRYDFDIIENFTLMPSVLLNIYHKRIKKYI